MIIGFQRSSTSLPSSLDAIGELMKRLCPVEEMEDGLRVTTHCLYPSNGLVRVIIRGGVHSVVVSDDGEALGEAMAAGIILTAPDKLLRDFVKNRGLSIRGGVIISAPVSLEESPVAIIQVANAAKEAANWLYDRSGIKRRHD